MGIKTPTHLNFCGDARRALAFYQGIFGGDVMVISYADAHAVINPAEADQVLWGQVAAPDGFHIMAYDVPPATAWDPGTNPGLRLGAWRRCQYADQLLAEAGRGFDRHSAARRLGFSPLYSMLRDRFGVTWVVDLQIAQAPRRPR